TDKDGLLDAWETNQGYTDAVSQNWIALPGADPGVNHKDLFVQVDYLAVRDANNKVLHSHLPRKAALDAVGDALVAKDVHVHFDLPPTIYQNDGYVISTALAQNGVGGKEISESSLVCAGALCPFPNQAAVAWKGGFESLKESGNFQPGRDQSYRYALVGHA